MVSKLKRESINQVNKLYWRYHFIKNTLPVKRSLLVVSRVISQKMEKSASFTRARDVPFPLTAYFPRSPTVSVTSPQSHVIPSLASADGFSRVLFRIYRYVTNVSLKAILVDQKFFQEQNLCLGHHRAECVTNINYSESVKRQIWMWVGHEKLYP